MKKKILIAFLLVLFIATGAFAARVIYSISSYEKTTNALIHTGKAAITAITVHTDGTNNAKVVVYDNTSGTGNVVFECTVKGSDHYGGRIWTPYPVKVSTGIYVVVTGTGASYIVEFFGAS